MTTQQMELLQKLEMIGNLESVVTEQKIRIEKLRTTYETLKAEHVQLKEVNERKEKELKDSKNEMRKIQDLSQETLQKMRIERDAKNQECEELRIQTHGILKRRIKQYGLRRRRPDYDIDDESILSIINGLGCLQGYRSVWHTLQLRGYGRRKSSQSDVGA